jgi:hypothetical protein
MVPPLPDLGITGGSTAAMASSSNSTTQRVSFSEPGKTTGPEIVPAKADLSETKDLPPLNTPLPEIGSDPPTDKPASVTSGKETDKTEMIVPPATKTKTEAGVVMVDKQANRPTPPAVRLVNSKRITINYEVKDVGPSGLSAVELWSTQDGKSWKKRDVSATAQPPYAVEVKEEGLYGFTLLARNGIGLGKEAPKSGDLPQIWVEVDMTKPVVELTGVNASVKGQSQNVIIKWKATDKNLGPKPITLSYAVKEGGPWQVIAANVPNSGRYVWPLLPEVPARFRVRVEATDLVGNVGFAQTPKPVLMDRSQPTVSILTVEANAR